jgi:hypothetical protein
MPTVLRVNGFRFRFYSDDHAPPHVHVLYGGAWLVVELETGLVRHNRRMRPADIVRAVQLVEEHQAYLLAAWVAFDQKRRNQNGLASH